MNPKFENYFKEQGFEALTPIQAEVAPLLAQEKSVLGLAPTGSGTRRESPLITPMEAFCNPFLFQYSYFK